MCCCGQKLWNALLYLIVSLQLITGYYALLLQLKQITVQVTADICIYTVMHCEITVIM